jgi:peptide chain release factor 2
MSLVILFDIPTLENNLQRIEALSQAGDFWKDQKRAKRIIAQINDTRGKIGEFKDISVKVKAINEELDLLRAEYSADLQKLIEADLIKTNLQVEAFEILILLQGEYDHQNAVLEIHPGAGGVESQDWAEMLYRMYVRYGERNNFKIETVEYQTAEEAGIKSATLILKGKNAYGFLKGEKGVHRLVRISPFDSNARRHTSFASVNVMPDFEENNDIVLNDQDLRIDTYRASGAGGQHVNKTESAVRITHEPSGIVVNCQSQRSQVQNKERALAMLKAKLYQVQVFEKQAELNKIRGEQKSIEWGSQIRSYVVTPYVLVKDHRTDFETSDLNGVFDGKIESLIYSHLKMEVKNNGK